MTTTPISAFLFDLDNTLFDREAAFRGLAEDFFDERLRGVTSLPRADAVALMVEWDDDGYSDRREMRERWLAEWPEAGLDLDAFNGWYRQVMARHTLPDAAVNDFLAHLNGTRHAVGHRHQRQRAPTSATSAGRRAWRR